MPRFEMEHLSRFFSTRLLLALCHLRSSSIARHPQAWCKAARQHTMRGFKPHVQLSLSCIIMSPIDSTQPPARATNPSRNRRCFPKVRRPLGDATPSGRRPRLHAPSPVLLTARGHDGTGTPTTAAAAGSDRLCPFSVVFRRGRRGTAPRTARNGRGWRR